MKQFVCLGEFTPYGREFLADATAGTHYQVPSERDGIIGEEEIYIAGDGRIIWSSGRHIVRGFHPSSRAVHVLSCTFSGLPGDAQVGGISAGGAEAVRCLGVLESDRFTVYAPSGAEFLVHLPFRATHAWPLADGALVVVQSADGAHHALSLVEHPLNLLRCVTYIEPEAAHGGGSCRAWKDALPIAGEIPAPKCDQRRLCWVCDTLPLAVAYVPETRRHAVYLVRRGARKPAAALAAPRPKSPGFPFEGLAMCREASEVFLQRLWTFPEEGAPCEPDGVFLLAPDPELARAAQRGAGSAESATGLLLALFVASSGLLIVVRLWSWEVVATLRCCRSAVPLLSGDDLRSRGACPSGLAGFPSRWYGSGHCRIVLHESNGPELPSAAGLPQPWADILLDPLELVRSTAVLCFDRHRLPQHMLVLGEDRRTLTLYWGATQLCLVELADSCGSPLPSTGPIHRLCDPVANRFTVVFDDGTSLRCSAPLQPNSPRLLGTLSALALLLPVELTYALASDMQVWCIQRKSGRGANMEEEDSEWQSFCELHFCLLEQALAKSGDAHGAPPFKRARTVGGGGDGEEEALMESDETRDWEWLLGSTVHARERLDPLLADLESSAEFVPCHSLRLLASDAARCRAHHGSAQPADDDAVGQGQDGSARGTDVWEGCTATPPALLLQHLDRFFLALHLMYEEWKMHALHSPLLPQLALFLYGLASRLECTQFGAFYAQDLPMVRDAAVAMAAYGGYGAWLWQVFPREKSSHASCAPAVERLRRMQVPQLLPACRQIQRSLASAEVVLDSFPLVFPLSSLLLTLLHVLQGCPSAQTFGKSRDAPGMPSLGRPGLVVSIPGVDPKVLDPPSYLAPFTGHTSEARRDAERARAVRRWLEGMRDPSSRPLWEVALMLLVQHGVRRADVELWSLALAAPVQECLRAAAEEPGSEWLVEAYSLIGREDLAALAKSCEVGVGAATSSTGSRRTNDILETANGLPRAADDPLGASPSADPLESPEWLYRMFDRDRRAKEVARLLNSSRAVTLRVVRRPEQTDHDFEQQKQSRLGLAACRQASLCIGRGAFTLGAVRPLPTEVLQTPLLTLAGRFPPYPAVVSLDPNHHSPELNLWAEFSNGVATALQVSEAPGSEITRGWIVLHKSEANSSGQSSANAHAGFLLGLGLRGSLKVINEADCYKYLRLEHDATSVAVILGMAASHVSSMDAGLTRMCCVHIPSVYHHLDIEVASPVQCAAVLSLGLLFAKSSHRMMAELLVAEIGRRPSDRALHDREGYSLAAGFALGCVCLGLGADAPGLADLELETWLLRYIHGGSEMPLPGVATRDQKLNPNHDPATCSSLVNEPRGINVSITSPGGCVALGLVFLRTNCEAVASRVVIPQTVFQLDYVRPDFSMLRLVAKSLIMWDSIEASEDWVEAQVPAFLAQLYVHAEEPPAQGGDATRTSQASSRGTPLARSWAPVTPTGNISATRSPPAPSGVPGRAGLPSFFETPSPSAAASGAAAPRGSRGRAAPLQETPSLLGSVGGEPSRHAAAPASDVDWLLVAQTRASLVAGACLAIGLRFAGTGEAAARQVLIERLRDFRDARRSDAHPALMASLPTPDMDLDRSTLDTCQSVTAMALGMVMAGTGDLSSLRMLRSLRRKADLKMSYGVHMATHTAIGYVFLGGGKYTFDQDPLSTAALLMAAFPRFPCDMTDNRSHLQAFRHLYVLAARHQCMEAVEVETQQPVDVNVKLTTRESSEVVSLPRLVSTSGDVQTITLDSERYWPVIIQRELPDQGPNSDRWMRALEASRRLYVKRRSGHLPHRMDGLGAQCAAQVWFPTFSAPEPHHVESLLQLPKAEAGGASAPQPLNMGGVVLAWLQQSGAEAGSGPLEPGTLAVSSAEWAAALCSEPPGMLPPGAFDFDFDGEEDGSMCERFGALVLEATRGGPTADTGGASLQCSQPPYVRYAHWLHECITESKLPSYPLHLLLFLQTSNIAAECATFPHLSCLPKSASCSSMACDQLVTVEWFYRSVRGTTGAKHSPLLSQDFLASRCAAMRQPFAETGDFHERLGSALRTHYSRDSGGRMGAAEPSEAGDAAVLALFCRLHGLPGQVAAVQEACGARRGRALTLLPRLRRAIPGASVQGLRKLAAALEIGVA
eukprot:CAMPEP_0203973408 /NCGR_PEP_ID=MMETSP0359-20131031/99574_1 /ASSEMBLY_ACC=CAM_ASM_000338 /TAXON_ID=268821 /ORGANISM="Scrippsiella Hangoei, Strain SHTV-5" /LENGTH=2141 /DNA_ID=CAMNT_0050911563 /DNA_START=1 /DNA_END=6427 /DNA_ORIENTATION=-